MPSFKLLKRYATVHKDSIIYLNNKIHPTIAAAFPEAFITAYLGIKRLGFMILNKEI